MTMVLQYNDCACTQMPLERVARKNFANSRREIAMTSDRPPRDMTLFKEHVPFHSHQHFFLQFNYLKSRL